MSHATRHSEANNDTWQTRFHRVFRYALVFLLIVVFGGGVWWAQEQFAQQEAWQVQRIRIVGEMRQLKASNVQTALDVTQGQTIADVDLARLTSVVSQLPWVKRVEVRKLFPGELVVHVMEREPWLRLNDMQMLDREGEPFSPDNVAAFAHLPRIDVTDAQRHIAVEEFLHANEVLAPIGLKVERLWLNGRGALAVKLNNNVMLLFGREDWPARLSRFVSIFPGLSKAGVPPEYVDLRYDTGVAVSWSEPVKEKTPKTAGL